MKRLCKFLVFSIITFMFVCNSATAQENETQQKIREGVFVKVMVLEEFSTLTADINDPVKFINTEDVYVYETNAIPKNTLFYGEIEDVREPVQGRDGSIKIFIYKMETPDKKIYNLNAHIYSGNDNYLGGGLTQNIYYRKVPHYNQNLRPFLQAAPISVRELGRHTVVKAGEELFVVFDKDVFLK